MARTAAGLAARRYRRVMRPRFSIGQDAFLKRQSASGIAVPRVRPIVRRGVFARRPQMKLLLPILLAAAFLSLIFIIAGMMLAL
ncbi:hypothetical protein [Chelativorans intermedius]|uniref:Uncharacterized protein n=1 Tax=Chelativorans intermedius TaxID=515947 RepID=A0ABV6DCH4_9HYPH|nr:hypothetical protein [Chelativorans intermedius]MCT9000425.1 hypothetical protein [Chelativorans intermedius]